MHLSLGGNMKKAVYIALVFALTLSLAGCRHADADPGDTTKDGVIGDGLETGLDDIGDDIRDDVRDMGRDLTGDGRDRWDDDGNVTGNGVNGDVGTGAQNGTDGDYGLYNGAAGSGDIDHNDDRATSGNGTTDTGNAGNDLAGSARRR